MQTKPKDADRLDPKGTVVGVGAEVSPTVDKKTTGGKKEPTSFVVQHMKHGKPVVFPSG